MPELLASRRNLFDIPRDVAYLNCAYMGPLSHPVIAAGAGGIAAKVQPWNMSTRDFFEPADRVRRLAAGLFGGEASDYALVPSASYGIAVAAANLPVSPGQDIVVLEEQFPSNVYAWRRLAEARRARVRTVTREQAGAGAGRTDWAGALEEAIGPDTAIVAVANCHWADGTLVDLNRVSAACRKVGAALVLDLTQSAGAHPVDLERTGADFAVFASYKWLLGPYATGLLYAAPARQNGVPLEENWLARAGSQDFAGLVQYQDAYQPGAQRYDMGERANFHLLPMLQAALEQIQGWGVANIARTLGQMTGEIARRARDLDFTCQPATCRVAHFCGLKRPAGLPEDLVARLARRNVHVSVRGDTVRVTPHLYNDADDIERFLSALKDCLA